MKKLLLTLAFILGLCQVGYGATFGETGTGDDTSQRYSGYVYVSKFTLTEAGTVSKISAYLQDVDTSGHFIGVIYDDDGTSAQPGTRLGYTPAATFTTTWGWYDATFSSGVYLAAGDYWIGIVADGSSTFNQKYEYTNPCGYARTNSTNNYPTPAATYDYGDGAAGIHFCYYATYTAGGGGGTPASTTGGSNYQNVSLQNVSLQ